MQVTPQILCRSATAQVQFILLTWYDRLPQHLEVGKGHWINDHGR